MRALVRILKVFWSPGDAFTEIAESKIPAWAPLIFLMVLGFGGALIFSSMIDLGELAVRAAEQGPGGGELTDEQRENIARIMNSPVARVFRYIGALFLPLIVLIISGIYFGVFMILGSSAPFRSFYSVTAHAFLPTIVSSAVSITMILMIPSSAINPAELGIISPAIFFDPLEVSAPLMALARSLDLVTIWVLVLLTIGYRRLAPRRTSAITVAVAVFGVWLVTVAVRVGFNVLVS